MTKAFDGFPIGKRIPCLIRIAKLARKHAAIDAELADELALLQQIEEATIRYDAERLAADGIHCPVCNKRWLPPRDLWMSQTYPCCSIGCYLAPPKEPGK